jgi:AcrR family transcriptional regulator
VRRSRKDQREATRQRLLDAAFACLVELGYGGASTAAIAKRAGVSSGALFNQFPTKDDLLVATVDDLFSKLVADLNARLVVSVAEAGRPVAAVVDVLWEGLRSPTIQALFELTTAARTRPALRAHLATVAPAHLAAMVAFSRHLFPDAAGSPHFDGTVGVVLTSLQGTASSWFAFGEIYDVENTKAELVRAVEWLVDDASRRRGGE